ncbi:MAG: hypothetical protein K0S80_1361, partial [Neobacillus sp.]|nr:hypothetical protein [Neobacillus sp.]
MVKIKIIGLLLLIGLLNSSVTQTFASVHVDGYFRNGKYVEPHFRSNPDGDFYNNWSTYGNINPYTGIEGTKKYPDYSTGSGYSLEVPSPTTGNGYNVKIPASTDNIDFKQLAEDRQIANEELTQEIKEQTERLEKEREEMNKRLDSKQPDTQKQIEESQKQIDESLKALAEASKEHTYDYTPYASSYEGVDRTLNVASNNITENKVESETVNKKAKPSKQN